MSGEEESLRQALAALEGQHHAPWRWDEWVARIMAEQLFLFDNIAAARRALAFFLAESGWLETAETERRRALLRALLAVRSARAAQEVAEP